MAQFTKTFEVPRKPKDQQKPTAEINPQQATDPSSSCHASATGTGTDEVDTNLTPSSSVKTSSIDSDKKISDKGLHDISEGISTDEEVEELFAHLHIDYENIQAAKTNDAGLQNEIRVVARNILQKWKNANGNVETLKAALKESHINMEVDSVNDITLLKIAKKVFTVSQVRDLGLNLKININDIMACLTNNGFNGSIHTVVFNLFQEWNNSSASSDIEKVTALRKALKEIKKDDLIDRLERQHKRTETTI